MVIVVGPPDDKITSNNDLSLYYIRSRTQSLYFFQNCVGKFIIGKFRTDSLPVGFFTIYNRWTGEHIL